MEVSRSTLSRSRPQFQTLAPSGNFLHSETAF
jgi:hypothetical protein